MYIWAELGNHLEYADPTYLTPCLQSGLIHQEIIYRLHYEHQHDKNIYKVKLYTLITITYKHLL